MEKRIFISFLTILLPLYLAHGQNTSIPDPNFEQALIDLGIDSDSTINGQVLTVDISEVTELNVFDKQITDLAGIEVFDSLRVLNCSSNQLDTLDFTANTKLKNLNCSSNLLTLLNVSANDSLRTLNCQENLLASLDVSSNSLLQNLDFTSNQISSIDISFSTEIISLKCANNQLSDLQLASSRLLEELICSSNQLTSLVVSANDSLRTLLCGSNQLTQLDLTENDSLTFLDCSDNQLASLDVDDNFVLEQLTCSANQLSSLNVDQNDSLRFLGCSNNQILTLDVSQNDSLESLICSANLLRDIDVAQNTVLSTLDFSFNLVEFGNFVENDSLTSLNCSSNRLLSLNIQNGNNVDLATFNALNNPDLACINVDNESEIGAVWLKDSTANYSMNCTPLMTAVPDGNFEQALIDLNLDTSPIDGFVVTDSIKNLISLDVSSQNIADLTGIEDFTALDILNCGDNQLISLDLIKNTALTNVDCSSNLLASLIIKNNNNANLVTFDAQNNPALTCIAVDDETQIGAGWTKDAAAVYADNCNPGETFVPDDNFEQALIDQGLDVGPLDNYVFTASIDTLSILNLDSLNIEDLAGIEEFAALDSLNCSANLLFDIDLSQNLRLKKLSCFTNYLPELDVTNNDSLVSLNCGNNRLSTLDVTQNIFLEELIVDSNFLTGIEVNANDSLLNLNCSSNNIIDTGLDVMNNSNLEQLFCGNNKLTTIDVTQNNLLTKLDCSDNAIEILNLMANDSLKRLDCSLNLLSTLELTSNVRLDSVNCNSNQLESLSFIANPLLVSVSVENNQLVTTDVSANDSLRTLLVSSNELTALDISNNDLLNILHCDDNQLDTLDVTNNPILLDLSCVNNHLDSLNVDANPALLNLVVDGNQLSNLEVSANTALLELSFARNQLDSIDICANPALTSLICDDNELAELDLANNLDLSNLSCANNIITGLDLSNQANLTILNSSSNALTLLRLTNGNNDTLSVLSAVNNPDLLCIEIDDENMIGESWQKDETAAYSENCHYNDTYVPDNNFESALTVITGEPDNNDDYILTSSIASLTSLDVSGQAIADLTGIEDFAALQVLNASNNSIDSVYLEENTSLENLNITGNTLNSLNLAENRALEVLDIASNLISELNLDSLDQLVSLTCSDNDFVDLSLANNPLLTSLVCNNNQLISLDIRNGSNSNLTTLNATTNPDLTCIQVDDSNDIGSGWQKDDTAEYNENCHYNETFVPDDGFEQALIDLGFDTDATGPLDDYVPTENIENLNSLNISGYEITDLTGIKAFVALTSLDCSTNDLMSLDIGSIENLRVLDCSNNSLTTLDISLNDSLRIVNVANNDLASLDLTKNLALNTVDFSSNALTGIDITANTNLSTVIGEFNNLFTVDANNGFNQNLTNFDLRNNPTLSCILVDDVDSAMSYTGWLKDPTAQYKLICDDDDNDGVPDDEDVCPATPFGSQVDLFGCEIFSLPTENFTVLVTSETCRTSNNGKINIMANEILDYTATLTSEQDSVSTYPFGDQVEIRNVRAGQYELCITVQDKMGYEQCYSVLITEPEDLRVISSGRTSSGRMSFDMSGSSIYIVDFNGLSFKTAEDRITLSLEPGKNTVQIKTEAACQGVFEQVIYYSEEVNVFPNPFGNQLIVSFSKNETEDVQINIYSSLGRILSSEKHKVTDGYFGVVDTSELIPGVYFVEVVGTAKKRTFRMIKK